MLSGVSMYSMARVRAALAVVALAVLAFAACDATPGLEPPKPLDGGPIARPGGSHNPDQGPMPRDAGFMTPGGAASGGRGGALGSGGTGGGSGAPVMPPVNMTDDDAGT
jgi:hypothetical protein